MKINSLKKLASIIITLIVASSLTFSGQIKLVQAQELPEQNDQESTAPLSLAVSPPTSYLYVKPSDEIKHTITLKNTGTQTLEVKMQLTDFKPDGKTGRPLLSSGTIFDKAVNPNLEFGQPFQIKPQENRTVTLALDASKLAKEKEYPLSILFNAQSVRDETNQASFSQVSGTVVSNLIVFISNQEENQGELIIEKFKAPRIIDSFQPIHFSLLAKNKGLNAMPVQGRALVKNFLGQTINEFIFYPDQILADSTRQVRGTELRAELLDKDNQLIPDKIENLSTEFKHQTPILFGPYRVEAQLDQDQASTYVIALPFSFIAAGLIGFLIWTGYQQLKKKM
jgi:hypothetical protein